MLNRREFVAGSACLSALPSLPALADESIRTRRVPGTNTEMPVVGLGNSAVFRSADLSASEALLELLHQHGGSYVDCAGASRFVVAQAARAAGLESALFMGAYFDASLEDESRADARLLQTALRRDRLSLMQCYTEQVQSHWQTMRRFKEEGLTQFIGTARHRSDYYPQMLRLMATNTLDALQVNYSILEPDAEDRVLPAAMDHGVAVFINRPFINGEFFRVVGQHSLPDWAGEFDCASWAQFSLKFILSHPAVHCVLTETANPRHAIDNLSAGFGRLPDAAMRERMRRHVTALL